MGKFDGVLFLADMDCTLLRNDKSLSRKNKRAIEYFKQNGGLFSAATGRSMASARTIIPQIEPNAPAILFNGALIYDYEKQKALHSEMADEASVRGVLSELMEHFPDCGIELYNREGIFLVRGNHVTDEHVVLAKLDFSYKDLYEIPGPYYKAIFLDEPEVLRELEDYVEKSRVFQRYFLLRAVYSEPRLYEIVKAGVTKGTALLKFAELYSIKRENTFAIGDNYNDIEMIRDAGFGFAVQNAVPEALEAADRIVAGNERDGVAEAIEYIDSLY